MLTMKRTAVQIQSWARQSAKQAIPDDVLIRRFAATRDEAAFAELVRRHGSLVLGVARRVLGDHHAAEDVLQATFLLLARKAAQIQWRRSIAPWLHTAAYRIARTARRRRRHAEPLEESQAITQTEPLRPLLWDEVRAAIDEELAKLPERLRSPLVLCYLQGRTRDEAARSLGWTLATLKRRLERGRKILNVRLTRRGLALSAIGAAMLIDSPALPAAIVERIVRPIFDNAVSAPIAALLEGQAVGTWKKLALALAMLTAIGLGTGLLAEFSPASTQPPAAEKAETPKPTAKVDLLGDPLPDGAIARLGTTRLRPGQLIQGIAFSPDGKQLAIWAKAWSGGNQDRLIFADPATGKQIKAIDLPPCYLHAMRWLKNGRGLAVVKIGYHRMRNQSDYFLWEFTDPNASLPTMENPGLNYLASGDLNSVAISPDGHRLAVGRMSLDGSDQPIELVEVKANARLSEMKTTVLGKQRGNGMFVVFSDDGGKIVALSRHKQPDQFAPVAVGGAVAPPPPIVPGKVEPGARLAVYDVESGKRVNEFDVASPLQFMSGSMPSPQRIALSPDGKSLWIGDEKGVVHAYDWKSGKETLSYMAHPAGDPKLYEPAGVSALTFSKDGRSLFTAGQYGGITIRDTKDGKTRIAVHDTRLVPRFGCLAVSAHGDRLAVADVGVSGLVRIFDPTTGKDHLRFPGHGGIITGLCLLNDGTAITCGYDRVVRRWDLKAGRELGNQPIDAVRYCTESSVFTVDGRGLFGVEGKQCLYVDLQARQSTVVSRETGTILGVSGSTVFVKTTGGKVQQWDAKTRAVRQTFEPPPPQNGQPNRIVRAIMSPDEQVVAIVSTGMFQSGNSWWYNGGQISLYDARSGELRKRWQTVEASWDCAAFSPDSRFFVVGGYPISGAVPGAAVESNMPFSVKSGLLLIDSATGDLIRTYDATKRPDGFCRVPAVAMSPNGQFLAAAQFDGSIAVYDLAAGELCKQFRGHRNEIPQMQFTADGRKLVSVSRDMTGLVWDVSFAALAKPSVGEREKLWVDLAKPEWLFAGPALAALANRPDDLMALVREHMKPADKPDFDRDAISKWVEQLDDQLFAVRERASASLSRLGRETLPLLHDHLTKVTSRERQTRLRRAIEHIRQSPVPSHHLREMRAIALLEQLGTRAARDELKRLANGNLEARLTREAQTALARGTKQ